MTRPSDSASSSTDAQSWHMSREQGLSALPGPDPQDPTFATVFKTDATEALIYAPNKVDLQEPHDRDEYYFIIRGHGDFINGEVRHSFETGDIIFVPAYQPHRFVDFSDDLAVWVVFYGPTKDSTYWSSNE